MPTLSSNSMKMIADHDSRHFGACTRGGPLGARGGGGLHGPVGRLWSRSSRGICGPLTAKPAALTQLSKGFDVEKEGTVQITNARSWRLRAWTQPASRRALSRPQGRE